MATQALPITEAPTLESLIAALEKRVTALEAAPKSAADTGLAELKKRLDDAGLIRDLVPEPKEIPARTEEPFPSSLPIPPQSASEVPGTSAPETE